MTKYFFATGFLFLAVLATTGRAAPSICETRLALAAETHDGKPRWRLREPHEAIFPVTQAVLPLSQLLTSGVAHIRVPDHLAPHFMSEASGNQWLRRVADKAAISTGRPDGVGEEDKIFFAAVKSLADYVVGELRKTLPDVTFNPGGARAQRIEWEVNNWHYDIGVTTKDNYNIYGSVSRAQRDFSRVEKATLLATLPFPMDNQAPSVVECWGGECAGKFVQAPIGYVTVFFYHLAWHRGDLWTGARRGLFLNAVDALFESTAR